MGRIDITGQMFGRYLVLEEDGRDKYSKIMYKCLCACGNVRRVNSNNLRSGNSTSCGCLRNEKVSKINKGKTLSKEIRIKMSMAKQNITNEEYWDGFTTPEHTKIRQSPKYAQWRLSVYERNNFTCQMCGDDKGGNLQAHHIATFGNNKKLIFTLWNGITLCKECHEKVNHHEAEYQAEFLNHNLQGFFKGNN